MVKTDILACIERILQDCVYWIIILKLKFRKMFAYNDDRSMRWVL